MIVEAQKRVAIVPSWIKQKYHKRCINISRKHFPPKERFIKRKREVWYRSFPILREGDSGAECPGSCNAANTSPQSSTESYSSRPQTRISCSFGRIHFKKRWSSEAFTFSIPFSIPCYHASTYKETASKHQVRSTGACGHKHDSCTSLNAEEDGRYWAAGNSYHGMMCGACGGNCRATARKPSYRCVDAETMGCMEIRCYGCYLDV